MAIEQMPLFDDGSYSYRITLDGVGYRFDFRYCPRHDAWYVSVYDAAGEGLRVGIRCVTAWPFNAGDPTPLMPEGLLLFDRVDDAGAGLAPIGLVDFPDRVNFLRITGDDIPTPTPDEALIIRRVSP